MLINLPKGQPDIFYDLSEAVDIDEIYSSVHFVQNVEDLKPATANLISYRFGATVERSVSNRGETHENFLVSRMRTALAGCCRVVRGTKRCAESTGGQAVLYCNGRTDL
jgi:hypothetical protein